MNRQLLSVGVGMFGLGALIGWSWTADHYEGKYEETIDLLEDRLEILRRRMLEAESHLLDQQTVDDGQDSPEGESDEPSEGNGQTEEQVRNHLQEIINQYTADPDDHDQFVDSATKLEMSNDPPFVISREKYAWDEEEGDTYAKITLNYFPNHRMLVDDGEEPVQDVANTVGWKNLKQFGGESGDPDTVFTRNRAMRTDFEVVRETEADIPIHIKYGLGKEEFKTHQAAGLIKLRPEDRD